MIRSVLYIDQILTWADEFHRRRHRWPNRFDGPVAGQVDVTWGGIDAALKNGGRGLRREFGSLAKLLRERRGRRHQGMLPRLSRRLILKHADAYRKQTGQWPTRRSGAVHGAPGETWQGFDRALIRGLRGLPSGSSVAQLLAARRGVRHRVDLPTLSPKQVRDWVVAFHNWMGHWPKRSSGAIPTAPGESWATIDC